MHHLHENTLPCYHQSLHNVLVQLRNGDLQIATRIFLRQGYFLEKKISLFPKSVVTKSLECMTPVWNNLLNSLSCACLRETCLCVLGFEAKQYFVSESQRLYDSEPAVLESLQQINDWVENATQGKMTDFLPALPHNVVLMLINAVHFKGEVTFDHLHF